MANNYYVQYKAYYLNRKMVRKDACVTINEHDGIIDAVYEREVRCPSDDVVRWCICTFKGADKFEGIVINPNGKPRCTVRWAKGGPSDKPNMSWEEILPAHIEEIKMLVKRNERFLTAKGGWSKDITKAAIFNKEEASIKATKFKAELVAA